MDELVLHQRSRRKAIAATAFLAGLGGVLFASGVMQALQGSAEALLAVFPFAMAGVLLFLAFVGIRGRGTPNGLVLTTQGLRISLGRDHFTLPASALRDFALVPLEAPRRLPSVKAMKLLKVRVDPAVLAGAPRYVARLRDTERPDELRLVVVGEAHVPEARVEEVRAFVRRHVLAGWDDRPQPA